MRWAWLAKALATAKITARKQRREPTRKSLILFSMISCRGEAGRSRWLLLLQQYLSRTAKSGNPKFLSFKSQANSKTQNSKTPNLLESSRFQSVFKDAV